MNRSVFTAIILLVGILSSNQSAQAQGTVIVQHLGYADPATEGFGLKGTGQVGGVTNDLGYNAWLTHWKYGSSGYYSASIGNIADVDWILSVTVRVAATNARPGEFFAMINTGASSSPRFGLDFGSDSNGNPIVATGGASGYQYSYTLTGAGSTYNNYQLVYDAGAMTASLWINGTEELSGIAGQFESGSAFFNWGGDSSFQASGASQANWNLVSLETVPEPTTVYLFFLGVGVLFYARTRKQHAA